MARPFPTVIWELHLIDYSERRDLRLAWKKGLLLSGVFVVIAVSFWFVSSPTHWLRKVDFGTVSVDGHQVKADIYFGNPEGEAVKPRRSRSYIYKTAATTSLILARKKFGKENGLSM